MTDVRDHTYCSRLSRRHFVRGVAVFVAVLAVAAGFTAVDGLAARAAEPAAGGKVTELSEHVAVYHGPINVGIVRDGRRALLIDCGDGSVAAALPRMGIEKVAQVVFTHHHRDQACGAYDLAARGTRIGVPEAERELFADPAGYWNDEKKLWCVSASYRPSPLTLTEPLKVDEAFADGHEITFGPAKIRVLDTPGHTNGAVSYLVEVDDPIRVDRRSEDGQSWQWHEFKLTAYNYPGQTLYHDALLVESGELRMFFVGDSHTMSGIDDYCAQNRNWLGRGVGFQYCISLIEKLKPTHIFNCHVADAFTFTPGEIRFMRANLDRREKLFGELVPWDHANYGTDASWVRCHPYTQQVRPGTQVQLEVVITNHSTGPNPAACRAVLPKAFGAARTEWSKIEVPAKAEKPLPIEFDVPSAVPPGRYVVPIDVQYGQRSLPQFAEAIVDVKLVRACPDGDCAAISSSLVSSRLS